MPASTHISLSELQALIKRGIDNAHPLPYWVTAEISELKVNYSGHCYIELVEKGGANHVPKAKASAVIWRSGYSMIASYFQGATGQVLAAGLKVLVKVVVSYHELYGLSRRLPISTRPIRSATWSASDRRRSGGCDRTACST